MCTHDEGALEEELVGIARDQADPVTVLVLQAEAEELGWPKLQVGRERPGVTRGRRQLGPVIAQAGGPPLGPVILAVEVGAPALQPPRAALPARVSEGTVAVDRLTSERDHRKAVADQGGPFVLEANAGDSVTLVVSRDAGAAGEIHLEPAPLLKLKEAPQAAEHEGVAEAPAAEGNLVVAIEDAQ